MIRLTFTIVLALLVLGCGRAKEGTVTIEPHEARTDTGSVPGDPFGSASAAYQRLKEVTDEALGKPWDGTLEAFAPWLEEQTVAVERSLALLKALRVGPLDVYAVANGRIALVYEHIARALTEASKVAATEGYDADWKGEQARIWEQASAFWARCVRSCATAGPHLDAWDLRCRAGLAASNAELRPDPGPKSPRQPN